MRSVLFRVDAGRRWGVSMGHAMRAMTVGLHFLVDHLVYFLMRDYPEGVAFVRSSGFQVLEAPADKADAAILLPHVERLRPALVVTDLPSLDGARIFDRCRELDVPTAAFDIRGDLTGAPDLVINSSAVPSFTAYPDLPASTARLTGPAYHVLRDVPEVQPVHETVSNVLLTCGGSDPAGLTLRALRALAARPLPFALHVVLGPAYADTVRVKVAAHDAEGLVLVHECPEDFVGLLSRADVVVTACGQTLYECAALGRPAVMLPSIEHEEEEAAFFAREAGFADVGRWDDAASPERLRAAVDRLMDPAVRRALHEAGQRLVDRQGFSRVCRSLRALVE
ncbi:MAG: hypothetical protein H0S85_11620 [Desulfovibrionaceae bacterium]|nr:hypothetical protein [Desulfovibrionaceae bacterium]